MYIQKLSFAGSACLDGQTKVAQICIVTGDMFKWLIVKYFGNRIQSIERRQKMCVQLSNMIEDETQLFFPDPGIR